MSRRTKRGDSAAADRWALVQEVFGEAIESPAEQRRAIVGARCGADAGLRSEVESLLLAHEQEGVVDRLTPLVPPARALLREPVTDWSGRTVAEYVVQQAIGAGGMGVVYKARDARLGRHVALKFLQPALSADPGAKARFIAEARAAAVLDHPNVCTIYGTGETGDGQLFIAMPLYEGETLPERIARGRLTFDEALPIALQVARGLEHAHDAAPFSEWTSMELVWCSERWRRRGCAPWRLVVATLVSPLTSTLSAMSAPPTAFGPFGRENRVAGGSVSAPAAS